MILAALALAVPAPTQELTPPAELFAARTTDHRRSQSPVKDQGLRGTCAAFALCGALETFDGVPTDLSEQLLYATVKLHEQSVDAWLRSAGAGEDELLLGEGNAFGAYLPLFGYVGTCHESVWPYDPRPAQAGPEVPAELRRFVELARIGPAALRLVRDAAGKWGFDEADAELLDAEAARDVARLRAELDAGTLAIPVGYRIHGPSWAELSGAGAPARFGSPLGRGARVLVHPGMMNVFAPTPADGEAPAWLDYEAARDLLRAETKDLATEVLAGRWVRGTSRPAEEYGGHAVLIVGHDADGFIAKNSWGTDWGAGGYFIVPYDYHRMYVNGGVILRAPRLRTPALSPLEATKRLREARFRLKVQPRAMLGGVGLHLSTWCEDLRDPNVEVVEYGLETLGAGGDWSVERVEFVLAGGPEERRGAPLVLGPIERLNLLDARDVRVRARYGVDVLDPADPSTARFVRECVFESVRVDGARTRDHRPR